MNTFWVKEDKRLYGNSMGIAMVTFYQSTGDTIFEWSWWKSASSCNSYRSIIFRWKICMFSSGKRNIHEVSVLKAVLGENFHLNFMTQWLIMHELFSCRLEMLVMISHFGTFIEDGKIACEYLFFSNVGDGRGVFETWCMRMTFQSALVKTGIYFIRLYTTSIFVAQWAKFHR